MTERNPPRRCSATTRKETPCKAWAVPTSDPPLCGAHGGGKGPPGPPEGNANALRHGFYTTPNPNQPCTIEEIITDLSSRQRQLSAYIDACIASNVLIPIEELAQLLSLHGQNASRLGRLLRDQRALSGEAADGIAGAIAQALDELGTELQVSL